MSTATKFANLTYRQITPETMVIVAIDTDEIVAVLCRQGRLRRDWTYTPVLRDGSELAPQFTYDRALGAIRAAYAELAAYDAAMNDWAARADHAAEAGYELALETSERYRHDAAADEARV